MLGAAGDRATRARLDPEAPRLRLFDPTSLYLAHTLAITETHVLLAELAESGVVELLRLETEPTCWRDYLGVGGTPQNLKPDLYAVTATTEFEDHWFFEIDQGTESLPTLLKKCARYERYRATGHEQVRVGVFPAVVWIMPDPRRAQRLRQAIADDHHLDARVFRVVDPGKLTSTVSAFANPAADDEGTAIDQDRRGTNTHTPSLAP
jgi:hypothetical protein